VERGTVMSVEKDWVTASGLRAMVLMHDALGHRCGYVGIPDSHPLHGVSYLHKHASLGMKPEEKFDVHGGLTFSGTLKSGNDPRLWWYGFDCAHAGDAHGR
jgi:hypothetical protein